jgi:hypothetical protein
MAAELCTCGHDAEAHPGPTGRPGHGICTTCGYNPQGVLTGVCMGWYPPTRGGDAHDLVRPGPERQRGPRVTGPAGATTPTEPPAGPPDLDHAIHAAKVALEAAYDWEDYDARAVACLAVEAAWTRIRAIQAELNATRVINAQLRDLTREQDQTIHAARNQVTELRDTLAELFDLLHVLTLSPKEQASVNVRDPKTIEARVRAALDRAATRETTQ